MPVIFCSALEAERFWWLIDLMGSMATLILVAITGVALQGKGFSGWCGFVGS